MNAQKAREMSKSASAGEASMFDVQKAIMTAAKSGKRSIFYHKPLSNMQMMSLKADGYKAEDQTDKDGTLISISW